jgi:hypothetical protein
MSNPNDSTSTGDDNSLSLHFLEFCAKVRNNDPSILPEPDMPFKIRPSLSEKEGIELANALLENTNLTNLALSTDSYMKVSTEAMAKYVRTSKHLHSIDWHPLRMWMSDPQQRGELMRGDRGLQQREEMLSCFLSAFQESTSLKELDMELPPIGGLSDLLFEDMLACTESLQHLILSHRICPLEDLAVAAACSGLKKNTTLRKITLEFSQDAATLSPVLTSLHDHPLLRRLCLRKHVDDLTGLDTLLRSEN